MFGSLLDHTVDFGDDLMIKASTLAILEVNELGLDGRSFAIVHCDYREDSILDDLTSEEAAVTGALYLVEDLGAAATIDVPGEGVPALLWRPTPPNAAIGDAIAARMISEGVSDAIVVHANGTYSVGIANSCA